VEAQTPATNETDPATALILAQPRIEISKPVEAAATFDRPSVRPGDTAIYRVTFNAMLDSIHWPGEVIAPPSLKMQPGAHGQIYLPAGAGLEPRSTFNTRVHATAAGVFTVPRYTVEVSGQLVTVPEAQLEVSTNAGGGTTVGPHLVLEADPGPVYVGQSFPVRVLLPADERGMIQALQQVSFNGEGFMEDKDSVRQLVQLDPGQGTVPSYIYTVNLTALRPGPQEFYAQAFTAGSQFTGPIVIKGGNIMIGGGPPQFTLIESAAMRVNVLPLPRDRQLPGYNGAIGQFSLAPPVLATNVFRIGDPVTLTVNVRGTGNLARLMAPPPPHAAGWRVFTGRADNAPSQLIRQRGYATFSYTLIATTENCRATPVIPFSYFAPEKGEFVATDIPSLPITVKPGAAPADTAALALAEAAGAEPEAESKLEGPAPTPGRTMASLVPIQRRGWFPAVQAVPAVLFGLLGWWDRRRRHHAVHPEIRLRRKARKALRREWSLARTAARRGDAPGFVTCAVNAMRAACAPHYPAEPRALVGSDVLPHLPEPAGAAAEVVQRIFAAAAAERFNAQPVPRDLLSQRAGLDEVLTQLEAKL
jgi:hypothetical protein